MGGFGGPKVESEATATLKRFTLKISVIGAYAKKRKKPAKK